MADGTKDGTESDVAKELRKTAEDEVARAMTGAMSNLPMPGSDGHDVKQQSSFLRKHLSVTPEHGEQEVDYVEPMPDPYGKAIKYLEQHDIMQLFQQLTASIVYNKPEKPLEFMMEEVEKYKKQKEEGEKK